MERIGYVTIKVVYNNTGKFQDIVSEMDYFLNHPDIIETEIVNIDYNETDKTKEISHASKR